MGPVHPDFAARLPATADINSPASASPGRGSGSRLAAKLTRVVLFTADAMANRLLPRPFGDEHLGRQPIVQLVAWGEPALLGQKVGDPCDITVTD